MPYITIPSAHYHKNDVIKFLSKYNIDVKFIDSNDNIHFENEAYMALKMSGVENDLTEHLATVAVAKAIEALQTVFDIGDIG